MTRIKILEIYATVLLIAVVVALLYVWMASPLGTSDKVGITMAISTVALVIVTSIYAWHTHKMAEEMREQRLSESLPLLVPDITRKGIGNQKLEPDEVDYGMLQVGKGLVVWWWNFGNGTAINSRFYFYPATSEGRAASFPSHWFGTLEAGGKKEVDFDKIFERYNWKTSILDDTRWHQISDTYRPRLKIEYHDIYERSITTVQEFRVEEQNGSKRAFLGELYFTINGRRLGGVSHND